MRCTLRASVSVAAQLAKDMQPIRTGTPEAIFLADILDMVYPSFELVVRQFNQHRGLLYVLWERVHRVRVVYRLITSSGETIILVHR